MNAMRFIVCETKLWARSDEWQYQKPRSVAKFTVVAENESDRGRESAREGERTKKDNFLLIFHIYVVVSSIAYLVEFVTKRHVA